jgi:hypothetical protein
VAPLLVVEADEGVQVLLQLLHAAIELLSIGHAEELVLERAVEALAVAVGLGTVDLRGPMLDLLCTVR